MDSGGRQRGKRRLHHDGPPLVFGVALLEAPSVRLVETMLAVGDIVRYELGELLGCSRRKQIGDRLHVGASESLSNELQTLTPALVLVGHFDELFLERIQARGCIVGSMVVGVFEIV